MNCCICHKEIADCWPPLCDDKNCEDVFKLEAAHDTWAREQANRDDDNLELDNQNKGA